MAGFDGIKVNHGALGQGAHDLLAAAQGIRARLDQLDADLGPLAGGWSGRAKQSYDATKARWDRAIGEMVLLLQDTSRGVDASNAEYEAADRRGADRF